MTMGRRFEVAYKNRSLTVCVHPIDEAWEFWLCEKGHRLMLGALAPIDDVLRAWRQSDRDPFVAVFESISRRLSAGELVPPETTEIPIP
jgi:hypothetical protein